MIKETTFCDVSLLQENFFTLLKREHTLNIEELGLLADVHDWFVTPEADERLMIEWCGPKKTADYVFGRIQGVFAKAAEEGCLHYSVKLTDLTGYRCNERIYTVLTHDRTTSMAIKNVVDRFIQNSEKENEEMFRNLISSLADEVEGSLDFS